MPSQILADNGYVQYIAHIRDDEKKNMYDRPASLLSVYRVKYLENILSKDGKILNIGIFIIP